jgi:tetratricopeptide (TPR) repeat protein
MAPSDSDSSRHNRDQLRQLVERDYARAESAEDAWEVLGVVRGASQEEVTARYEEYDQLYRADNLEKLDDNDLTRKALELRKMISRAIVEIQTQQDQGHHEEFGGQDESTGVVASIDPDSLAMADIYFRDGLGWLKLQDYESAVDCFQRSLDHDPSQGVTLAYHTYAQFKRDPENPSVVEDCRDSFETAVSMEPDDVEIRILQARFGLETQQFAVARNAIERAESLKPNHSEVRELRRLYDDLAN